MDYILTAHAKQRIKERIISMELIDEALRNPTAVLYDTNDKERVLIKKLYKKKGKPRLVLIAGIYRGSTLKILTIIETSKVKKYL